MTNIWDKKTLTHFNTVFGHCAVDPSIGQVLCYVKHRLRGSLPGHVTYLAQSSHLSKKRRIPLKPVRCPGTPSTATQLNWFGSIPEIVPVYPVIDW